MSRFRYRPQVTVTFEDGRRQTFFPEEITDVSKFEGAKTYRAHIVSLEDRDIIVEALKRVGIEPAWGQVQEKPDNGRNRGLDDGIHHIRRHHAPTNGEGRVQLSGPPPRRSFRTEGGIQRN